MQQTLKSNPTDERIQRRVEMLRTLYPDYSDAELRDAYDNLIHYFDLIWRFYERMLKDGTLDQIFDTNRSESYDVSIRASPPSIKQPRTK